MSLFYNLIEDEKKYTKEMRGKTVSSTVFNSENDLVIRFTDKTEYVICGIMEKGVVVVKAITEEELLF